jgi:hypothetical protein
MLYGLLTNKNKSSGEKIKFRPPPPCTLWGNFWVFLENIIRRSVRVLKLHRVLFSQKKEILTPQTNLETHPGPLGVVFSFLIIFFKFKSCPRVPNFGYDF